MCHFANGLGDRSLISGHGDIRLQYLRRRSGAGTTAVGRGATDQMEEGSVIAAGAAPGADAGAADDELESWTPNALCKMSRHKEVDVCESMTSDTVRAADQICSQKRVAHIFDRDTDDRCYLDYKQMDKCNDAICNGAPIISIKVRGQRFCACFFL